MPALGQFLGSHAGLSASTVTRLTETWSAEAAAFMTRDLSAADYVYLWVDGIHLGIRLGEGKLCLLVMIGVRADGRKELVALGDLRYVRGTDVACRSGGVVVSVRGARARAVPVLSRCHSRLLAAAAFAGNALICGGADPGRRNITNPLITALDGGTGLPGWTPPGCAQPGWPAARSCSGWPHS